MSDFWTDLQRQTLYDMPLDGLWLGAGAIKDLNKLGIQSIGDCLDFLAHKPRFADSSKSSKTLYIRLTLPGRLRLLGYGKFLEQGNED